MLHLLLCKYATVEVAVMLQCNIIVTAGVAIMLQLLDHSPNKVVRSFS